MYLINIKYIIHVKQEGLFAIHMYVHSAILTRRIQSNIFRQSSLKACLEPIMMIKESEDEAKMAWDSMVGRYGVRFA